MNSDSSDSDESGLRSAELSVLLANWEQGRSPEREVLDFLLRRASGGLSSLFEKQRCGCICTLVR